MCFHREGKMSKGNVLLIGNSGVGKSTLVNAVLGENLAITGYGTKGTTTELKVYENGTLPFRVIDTVGFTPVKGMIKFTNPAVKSVQELSKKWAGDNDDDNDIHAIWFCVDGSSSKLFESTVKDLLDATKIWKSVPIITVITKSYSEPDRERNIRMVESAFAKVSDNRKPVRIIPVVAQPYYLTETAFAPQTNITELIDLTNEILPEGMKAAETDIADYQLSRKRKFAHTAAAAATVSAATIGAVPVPFADAMLLGPIEVAEITGIAKIYEIGKGDELTLLKNTIVEVGTVSTAAKAAISALKAIPGINLATGIVNAVIAGGIVAALGEGSIFIFEQIALGKRDASDIDWVKKVMEGQLAGGFISELQQIFESITNETDIKTIGKMVFDIVMKSAIEKKPRGTFEENDL